MEIVTQVTGLLQGLLSESMDALARETGCVKRERKFSGSTLLSSLVLTVLRKPTPQSRDYQTTAAQLGVIVTEDAIAQRFTPDLVNFLEPALQRVLGHVLTADAPPIALLERFAEVVIGDSTTIALPDEYADRFPGCGGSHGGGQAALKIQVLWELRHGTLHVLLEPGRASDAKSPISAIPLAPGTLSIFDLGYFSVERFERAQKADGYWLSRLQHGTAVCDERGQRRDLRAFLEEKRGQRRGRCAGANWRQAAAVPLGGRACAAGSGRAAMPENPRKGAGPRPRAVAGIPAPPSLDDLRQQLPAGVADVEGSGGSLPRGWQIERLFKLWKSYNHLADRQVHAPAAKQLAEVYIKLIAVIVQHGMLLMAVWLDGRRSLWRAAASLAGWVAQWLAAIDDPARLERVLDQQRQSLSKSAP